MAQQPHEEHGGRRGSPVPGADREPQQERDQQREMTGLPGSVKPGDQIANPAQPYAATIIPDRVEAKAFARQAGTSTEYPKWKYHPVHGGVELKSADDERGLFPKTDWFDTPELADLARTHTEAMIVYVRNQQDKLEALDKAGLPVIRNSVQADEAIRRAKVEPL